VAVVRGNRLVLSRFSLYAESGDIIWLRGINGSGKSTLLRLIAGLLPKASGTVSVDGSIALADENSALDGGLSVERALRFWARLDGASAAALEQAMAANDLLPLAEIPLRFLSTGQRKRANLARAMASGASIWLLDEPYNGLDSASATRLDAAILRHAASGGIAVVAAHQVPSVNVAQSILLDRRTSQ
jgi:heme exporter protein A